MTPRRWFAAAVIAAILLAALFIVAYRTADPVPGPDVDPIDDLETY